MWLDRLTVAEANTAVTNYTVDMEKYNAQLKTEGIVLEDNSNYHSEDGGKTYNLTTDNGYVFNISEPTLGDIVIDYIGKDGELLPFIKEIKVVNTTTNSSKIEVEVARLEDGKLTYEYKKHAEENYTLLKENKEITAEFTNLAQNEIYDIKVTAENKNGKSEEKIISIYTGKLEEGTISQKGETVWSNNQASIELQTTDTVNTMQYQKNAINGTWQTYTGTITGLVHRDTVYARMFDGTNGNSPYSVEILDDIEPQNAIINLSKTTTDTATPITATVTQTDNESGVDISKCKWVYNTTSTLIGTDEASYTGGAFSANPQTISLTANTVGTYYLHVLTIDKAGNKKESISGAITVRQLVNILDLGTIQEENKNAKDTKGNIIVVPRGFKVVLNQGTSVQQGIVIEDINGNQFVWIPVGTVTKDNGSKSNEIKLGRYTFDNIGTPTLQQSSENYIEEIIIDSTKELSNYRVGVASDGLDGLNAATKHLKEFVTSVQMNGGYYFARYEASYGSGNNISNYKPLSKISTANSNTNMNYTKGTLWNFTTQIDASRICQNMYNETENVGVESDLTNGYAWDTAIIYIQEMGNTNYSNKSSIVKNISNTGTIGDKVCNVNDMASNLLEWTTEYSPRIVNNMAYAYVYRGGNYSGGSKVEYRYSMNYNHGYKSIVTFRPVLYVI